MLFQVCRRKAKTSFLNDAQTGCRHLLKDQLAIEKSRGEKGPLFYLQNGASRRNSIILIQDLPG